MAHVWVLKTLKTRNFHRRRPSRTEPVASLVYHMPALRQWLSLKLGLNKASFVDSA